MTEFQLLVNLASKIIQTSQICIQNALKEMGLGSAEANILMFLYTNGDGIRQDDIVAGVEVSKPAISRTVTSLERKGFIRREQSPFDKRCYVVWLTDRALKEKDFIEEQFANLVNVAVNRISPEKVTEFIEAFKIVALDLDAYRKDSHGRSAPERTSSQPQRVQRP